MVSSAIGGMEAQLRGCVAYVKERKAFGKPIAEFEMIQDKLARMRVGINAARGSERSYTGAHKRERRHRRCACCCAV